MQTRNLSKPSPPKDVVCITKRRILRKAGYEVLFFVDEFRTSNKCSLCTNERVGEFRNLSSSE